MRGGLTLRLAPPLEVARREIMNDAPRPNNDVALFIDWENFKISLASGTRTPNVSALKEEVSNYGRVVVAKAYADWVTRAPELRGASQFTIDPPALYAAGIEPVYVPTRLPQTGTSADPTRTSRVKNSVDVKMTADCIECAHSHSNINTYVLVSGDSDFIHVVNALRAMGKRVIIIGVSWSTSRRLADQVDGLILYDVDVDPVTPAESAAPVGNGRAPSRLASPAARQQLPEVIRVIEDIVRSERQAGRSTLLTSLKQRVMRRIPGFDEKKMGFSGFKKLVQRVAQEGNVKLVTVGLVDWVIMSDEPDPQEVTSDSSDNRATASEAQETSRPESPAESPVEEGALEIAASAAPAPAQPPRNGRRKRSSAPKPPQTVEAVEPAQPQTADVAALIVDSIKSLELPKGPEDGQDAQRVADLIVMADTLEHREGISHVAFNFLLAEVCNALDEGLKAEHEIITQHWGQMHSRNYVTRLLRSLGNAEVFERGWHTGKNKETGRSTRRSTFNLNRGNPLVETVLRAQWNQADPPEPPTGQPRTTGNQPEISFSEAGYTPAPQQVSPEPVALEPDGEAAPQMGKAQEAQPVAIADVGASGIGRVMRLFTRS
jgi:uncharacterized LabA/DUF88 family protein